MTTAGSLTPLLPSYSVQPVDVLMMYSFQAMGVRKCGASGLSLQKLQQQGQHWYGVPDCIKGKLLWQISFEFVSKARNG
jgi:hypothetical protein